MANVVIQFAAMAVIIIVAGVFLSRFADDIAERTGFGRLLLGSILLAGATSLPELSIDVSAVRKGMADLALGLAEEVLLRPPPSAAQNVLTQLLEHASGLAIY